MKVKNYLFFFCCLLTIAASETFAQSATFTNVQVKARFQQSPALQSSNYSTSNQSNCEWLVLNISYTVPGSKSNESLWLDDVSIEAEILFTADYQGKKVMALVNGKTLYWSIEMNGKPHQEIMVVPPDIFKRYAPKGTAYKTIFVAGRVIFYSKSRSILGGGYFYVNQSGTVSDKEIAGMFEKYNGPVSNSLRIENMIFPRDKSPWADIQCDFYDLIKPEIKK
ncbi:MAG: hypothetical protein WCI51_11365 [Lentisphaerota bacterium]